MNLYEINSAIMDCMNEVDEETGELLNAEELDGLLIEKNEKIENIALWIKNLRAEAEALKAEKDSFAKRQKSAENKMEQLRNYLMNCLDGKKFKTEKVAITFRKSESVEVDDFSLVDEKYLKYKEPEIDKMMVKKDLKNGCNVAGVHLCTKQNIQIK